MAVIAWVGFAGGLYLLVATALDPERRNTYPSAAFMWLALSYVLVEFGLTMTSWVGVNRIQCDLRGLCKAQGILLELGSIAGSSWLFLAFLFLLCKLLLPNFSSRINGSIWKHALHIYGWGPAIALTAIYPFSTLNSSRVTFYSRILRVAPHLWFGTLHSICVPGRHSTAVFSPTAEREPRPRLHRHPRRCGS